MNRDPFLNIEGPSVDLEEAPWSGKEEDELFERYFSGRSIASIAKAMGRSEKSVSSKWWKLIVRYRGCKYTSTGSRKDREGKSFSGRDKRVIELARKWKSPPAYAALIMSRTTKEVVAFVKEEKRKASIRRPKRKKLLDDTSTITRYLSSEEDLVLAHRFLYYVTKTPILSDTAYDELEHELLEFGSCPVDSPVHRPGSDKASDYPEYIRPLALYLGLKYGAVKPSKK